MQDITSKWAEVRQLVPQRDGTLQQELAKQQSNEMMRRQFAEKANGVGPWIERQMDAVASIAMGMQVRSTLSTDGVETSRVDVALISSVRGWTLHSGAANSPQMALK